MSANKQGERVKEKKDPMLNSKYERVLLTRTAQLLLILLPYSVASNGVAGLSFHPPTLLGNSSAHRVDPGLLTLASGAAIARGWR